VGLSLYWDGVRMNTPFGSNIFWDLIPINALAGVDVLPAPTPCSASTPWAAPWWPAAARTTRAPSSAPWGSFRRKALRFEVGGADAVQGTDHFLAGNWDQQAGYRSHSDSDVRQLFGKTAGRATAGAAAWSCR
jgi:hypothetical protein